MCALSSSSVQQRAWPSDAAACSAESPPQSPSKRLRAVRFYFIVKSGGGSWLRKEVVISVRILYRGPHRSTFILRSMPCESPSIVLSTRYRNACARVPPGGSVRNRSNGASVYNRSRVHATRRKNGRKATSIAAASSTSERRNNRTEKSRTEHNKESRTSLPPPG